VEIICWEDQNVQRNEVVGPEEEEDDEGGGEGGGGVEE